jgi:hypothetical protein
MFPNSGPVNIRFAEADFLRASLSVLNLCFVRDSDLSAEWSTPDEGDTTELTVTIHGHRDIRPREARNRPKQADLIQSPSPNQWVTIRLDLLESGTCLKEDVFWWIMPSYAATPAADQIRLP